LRAIVTAMGTVKATGNHLFPVLRGHGMEWVRADELVIGDHVAVPRHIPTSSQPPRFEELLPADAYVRFQNEPPGRRRARLAAVATGRGVHPGDVEHLAVGPGGFCSSYLHRYPEHVNESVAYLCGLLASDGCLGKSGKRTIAFYNTEWSLHERART